MYVLLSFVVFLKISIPLSPHEIALNKVADEMLKIFSIYSEEIYKTCFKGVIIV